MKGKLTIGKVKSSRVVEFCFQSSSVVDFKVKVKVGSTLLSVTSILHLKLV